jgi:hypothetical protein
MKTKQVAGAALAAVALTTNLAFADVQVERRSDENPMVEIARSTIYGGLAGLAVGLAFVALDKNGDHPDLVSNSFAIGTLAGLGVGIYWVTSRPQPSALIQVDETGTHMAFAPPEVGFDGSARMRLVGVRF